MSIVRSGNGSLRRINPGSPTLWAPAVSCRAWLLDWQLGGVHCRFLGRTWGRERCLLWRGSSLGNVSWAVRFVFECISHERNNRREAFEHRGYHVHIESKWFRSRQLVPICDVPYRWAQEGKLYCSSCNNELVSCCRCI